MKYVASMPAPAESVVLTDEEKELEVLRAMFVWDRRNVSYYVDYFTANAQLGSWATSEVEVFEVLNSLKEKELISGTIGNGKSHKIKVSRIGKRFLKEQP